MRSTHDTPRGRLAMAVPVVVTMGLALVAGAAGLQLSITSIEPKPEFANVVTVTTWSQGYKKVHTTSITQNASPTPLDVDPPNAGGQADISVQYVVNAQLDALLQSDLSELYNGTAPSVLGAGLNVTRLPGAVEVPAGKSHGDTPSHRDLRVEVTMVLKDMGTSYQSVAQRQPDLHVTVGYDTGSTGTLPPVWNAKVGGAETLFKDTYLVVDSGRSGTYTGPLDLVVRTSQDAYGAIPGVRVAQPKTVRDLSLAYRPMPRNLGLRYTHSTPSGQAPDALRREATDRIVYRHDFPPVQGEPTRPVDVVATVETQLGDAPTRAGRDVSRLVARVDRAPSRADLTLTSKTLEEVQSGKRVQVASGGTVDLAITPMAVQPAQYPDVAVTTERNVPPVQAGDPLRQSAAAVEIDSVPARLTGTWWTPESDQCLDRSRADCRLDLRFDVDRTSNPAAEIGAVEVVASNVVPNSDASRGPVAVRTLSPFSQPLPDGELGAFPAFPRSEQYASIQSRPSVTHGTEKLSALRIRSLKSVRVQETADGLHSTVDVGNGQTALDIQLSTDERHVRDRVTQELGNKLDARAVVTPLPNGPLTVQLDGLYDAPNTLPTAITYSAGRTVDVAGHVEMRAAEAAENARCGEIETSCADFRLDRMPRTAKVVADDRDDLHSAITVETGLVSDVSSRPDAVVHLLARGDATTAPTAAALDLLGLPAVVRVTVDEQTADAEADPPVGTDELERLHLVACDPRTNPDGTFQRSGDAAVCDETRPGVRSVTARARNTRLPLVGEGRPYAAGELYTAVSGRPASLVTENPQDSDLFDLTARLTDLREVLYYTKGDLVAARLRAGDGTKPFHLVKDGKGERATALQRVEQDGRVRYVETPAGTRDQSVDARLGALPRDVTVCFRNAGRPPVALDEPIVDAACDSLDPFGKGAERRTAPLSVNVRAATSPGDLKARLTQVSHPVGANGADLPDSEDTRLTAELGLSRVPSAFTAHIGQPTVDEPGLDASFRVEGVTGTPPALAFEAQIADGDHVCGDPRVPAEGKSAFCVRAQVPALPEQVTLSYDPAQETENFRAATTGGTVSINDLALTGVVGHRDDKGAAKAVVLAAEGAITNLPAAVVGTIGTGQVLLRAVPETSPVGHVDLTAQTYIAPDPLQPVQDIPVRAAVTPAHRNSFLLQGRGDRLRLRADLHALRSAGYEVMRDSGGNLLDTSRFTARLGGNRALRVYGDLEVDVRPNETVPSRIVGLLADVVLTDVPASVEVCLRGKRTAGTPPTTPTFCDTAPADDQSAFRVSGAPDDGSTSLLDVDAFVRMARDRSSVTAARARITDIPAAVQGVVGDNGRVRIEGRDAAGALIGIGEIHVEVSTGDLEPASTGFGTAVWGQSIPGPADWDDEPQGQLLRLRSADSGRDSGTRLEARLGTTGAGPASRLRSLEFSPQPCASSGASDYPHLPVDPSRQSYTCLLTDLQQVGDGEDPLAIELDVDNGGRILELHEGRLRDLPERLRVNLARAATLTENGSLRTPCGTAVATTCMPPLLRLDTSSPTKLEGALRVESGPVPNLGDRIFAESIDDETAQYYGKLADLSRLVGEPYGQWSASWADGVRARVNLLKWKPQDAPERTDVRLRAGLRIPVAQHVQIDQVQVWSGEPDVQRAESGSATVEAPPGPVDLRLRVRNMKADGTAQDTGQLAAVVTLDERTGPAMARPRDFYLNGVGAETSGMPLPGDFGLNLYLRARAQQDPQETKKRHSAMFVQVDGRSSAPLGMRVRMSGDQAIRDLDARIRNLASVGAGQGVDDPSFRLRAEIVDRKAPEEGAGIGCVVFCVLTNKAHVERITADIDFAPVAATPARRVEAVVSTDLPQVVVDVHGYSDVAGAEGTGIPAPISGKAEVRLSPITAFVHVGVPILGDFNALFSSGITAVADFDKATNYLVQSNLLHLAIEHQGPASDAAGQAFPGDGANIALHMKPTVLTGLVSGALFALLGAPVPFGLTYAWIPAAPPAALMTYAPCGSLNPLDVELYDADAARNERIDVVGFPYQNAPNGIGIEPRTVTYGVLPPLTDDVAVPAIFCNLSKFTLNERVSQPSENKRGKPAPPSAIAGHPVPGYDSTASEAVPASPDTPLADRTLVGGEYCGTISARNLTLPAGTTIRIARTAGANCPSDKVNTLTLHALDQLTISGTLEVGDGTLVISGDDVTVSATGEVGGGSGETVRLQAVDQLTIAGKVLSERVITSKSPSFPVHNAGAGHGGVGGGGSKPSSSSGNHPAGGFAYGPQSVDEAKADGAVAERPGSAGGKANQYGLTGGPGGGIIQLSGKSVRVTGTVGVDGGVGTGSTSGQCRVNDNPNTEPNEAQPNTGLYGGGGGSGGTVYIAGNAVDLSGGSVRARGGAGGSGKRGGGGGGAGGLVLVLAPTLEGSGAVSTAGGAGATSQCPEYTGGLGGGSIGVVHIDDPSSSVGTITDFWQRPKGRIDDTGAEKGVTVPYTAYTRLTGSETAKVVLCGAYHAVPSNPTSAELGEQWFGIDMPDRGSASSGSPCGTSRGDTTVHKLAEHTLDATTVGRSRTFSNVFSSGTPAEGYWGLYTTLIGPGGRVERVGSSPDAVMGLDTTPPQGSITTTNGQTTVESRDVSLRISGTTDALSGLAKVECSNGGGRASYVECFSGDGIGWALPSDAAGPHDVYLRVTDKAGNEHTQHVSLGVSGSAPSAALATVGNPDGQAGWFLNAPSVRVSDLSPTADHVLVWVDAQSKRRCNKGDAPCDLPLLVGDGVHDVSWQAVSATGRLGAVKSLQVKVDAHDPTAAVLVGPHEADGANGWHLTDPLVLPVAYDAPGASGLLPAHRAGAGPRLAIRPLSQAPSATTPPAAAAFTAVTAPRRLGDGAWQVCALAEDVAGRTSEASCRAVRVDLADPVVTLQRGGGQAANAAGWNAGSVSITPVVSGLVDEPGAAHLAPGSRCPATPRLHDVGLGNDAEHVSAVPVLRATCVTVRGVTSGGTRGGVSFASDPSYAVPTTGSIDFTSTDTGRHLVEAWVVDVSGRRAQLANDDVRVDAVAPQPAVRVLPGDGGVRRLLGVVPSADARGFADLPLSVAGVAGEQRTADESGVSSLVAAVVKTAGSVTTTYNHNLSTPLPLDDDALYALTVTATDRAGNATTATTQVDLRRPAHSTATKADRAVMKRKLGSIAGLPTYSPNPLRYTVTDDRPGTVKVQVLVYGNRVANTSGTLTLTPEFTLLRRLDAPDLTVSNPGQVVAGVVDWDGQVEVTLDGESTLRSTVASDYHYRVRVTDAAGNVWLSNESGSITVDPTTME